MHFAAHPYAWPLALGFRMVDVPTSRVAGVGGITRALMALLGRDPAMPTAVGLEREGEVLVKPFCPPYYPTMADAVRAFVDYKLAENSGTLRDRAAHGAWRDGASIQGGIHDYSDETVAAVIAYCEYVYRRYGRFPASSGPFRTVLAYQAHHLDPDFYDRFYKPGTLTGRSA
jgi:hypothetical protein